MRASGAGSSCSTAHRLRVTLESRVPMIHPATRPRRPEGRWNCRTTVLVMRCGAMRRSQPLQVRLKSMGTLTIGELARRTGLATSALRFYEERGLLEPRGRQGGRRIYDETAV